jgi:hypothetical protein
MQKLIAIDAAGAREHEQYHEGATVPAHVFRKIAASAL